MRVYLNKIWLASFNGICSNEAMVFEVDTSKIDPIFLHEILLTDVALKQIVPMQTGTSLPRVDPDDILAIKIPLPNKDKQKDLRKFILEKRTTMSRLKSEADQIVAEARVKAAKLIIGEE